MFLQQQAQIFPVRTLLQIMKKLSKRRRACGLCFEDYGFLCQGLASTVALALDDEIKVLRQGEVVID